MSDAIDRKTIIEAAEFADEQTVRYNNEVGRTEGNIATILLPASLALLSVPASGQGWTAPRLGMVIFFVTYAVYLIHDVINVYWVAVSWNSIFERLRITPSSVATMRDLKTSDSPISKKLYWDFSKAISRGRFYATPIEKLSVSFGLGVFTMIIAAFVESRHG